MAEHFEENDYSIHAHVHMRVWLRSSLIIFRDFVPGPQGIPKSADAQVSYKVAIRRCLSPWMQNLRIQRAHCIRLLEEGWTAQCCRYQSGRLALVDS